MNIRAEAHNIEQALRTDQTDHTKAYSAFHTELEHIRKLDSKNGVLNCDQYTRDLGAITKQMEADGLLPKFMGFLHDDGSGAQCDATRSGHDNTAAGAKDTGPAAKESRREVDTAGKEQPHGGKLYELHGLEHRTGDYSSPDAMVLLPKDFDPNKPIHLVVYDHGWYDTAKSSFDHARLEEQMAKAPPNTVLIVPEWQRVPGSSGQVGGEQGAYSQPGFAAAMVQDIFGKTPELKGKTLADVDQISIISHSAGFHAAESQLTKPVPNQAPQKVSYDNEEFYKKITSVTLLDSLYDAQGFDKWLKENIGDLSSGKKHFYNIFGSSTAAYSRAQAERVQAMLAQAQSDSGALSIDFSNAATTAPPGDFKHHGIVIKATSTPHMQIPTIYPGIIEAAAGSEV